MWFLDFNYLRPLFFKNKNKTKTKKLLCATVGEKLAFLNVVSGLRSRNIWNFLECKDSSSGLLFWEILGPVFFEILVSNNNRWLWFSVLNFVHCFDRLYSIYSINNCSHFRVSETLYALSRRLKVHPAST